MTVILMNRVGLAMSFLADSFPLKTQSMWTQAYQAKRESLVCSDPPTPGDIAGALEGHSLGVQRCR